jgi:hypothetical protein
LEFEILNLKGLRKCHAITLFYNVQSAKNVITRRPKTKNLRPQG